MISLVDADFIEQKTVGLESFYEYEYGGENQIIDYHLFNFTDLPKLEVMKDTTIVLQVKAKNLSSMHGVAYICFDKNMDITYDKFIINDTTAQKPLLVNSMIIDNDCIIECKIENLFSYHPSYLTKITLSQYDHNMNLLTKKHVKEDGYYYPLFMMRTEDGGYLIGGYSKDMNNYKKQYSYILKVDKNATLSVDNHYNIDMDSLYVYPNPANEYIIVELAETISKGNIILYNHLGIVEFESEINSNSTKIETGDLSNGIHYLKIISDN